MPKIQDFCQEEAPTGWNKITVFPDTMSFIRMDGVHFQASIIDVKGKETLHVSIAPLRACQPNMTDEEHAVYLLKQTPGVLNEFFVDRKFKRMPVHELTNVNNHYLSEI